MKYENYDDLVKASQKAHKKWRIIPAPQRGEIIRQFGNEIRNQKSELAKVITKEARKIVSEAEGEVQEAIDMCDFATGLSRQLYGLTMPSERPDHRLQELWQPIGIVGCITAFNFPMAVFAWNFCLASVCGNSIIWKPSPHATGCADAIKKIWDKVAGEHKELVLVYKGGNDEAIALCKDPNISLVSATGSTQMGKELAPLVSARLGRTLLELGGNNAAIICPTADLDLTVKGVTFSAAGTTAVVPAAENVTPFTVRSKSAVGHIIAALLPPNSNKVLPNLADTNGANSLPIWVLPVATGSTQMGKELAPLVSARLGRTLLELGGNNAAIICPTADLDLTVKGVTFSAAGTTAVVPAAENVTPFTVRSKSAVGHIIAALLPPNSNKVLPNLADTNGANSLPIWVLPVADTKEMLGSLHRAIASSFPPL